MFSFVERKSKKLAMMMAAALVILASAAPSFASEAELVLPDLTSVSFFGMTGWTLLFLGLFVCAAGALFGMVFYKQLRDMPVHSSMLEVSELIYETRASRA